MRVDPEILYQYRVVNDVGSKAGHLVLLGPFLAKRSLDIDETQVQEWIDSNKDILSSMRASSINKRYPKMIVVLSEWTSNTWTHISWNRKDDRPQVLDLVQQSPQAAPQWNYSFSYHKGSMTHMTGNRTVSIASKFPFLTVPGTQGLAGGGEWSYVLYDQRTGSYLRSSNEISCFE